MTTEVKARRGGRPPRHRAEAIRDEILDHAAALFFEQGYGATSIEAVAARAGMSKRTFYARFEDKAALFAAVIHRIIDVFRQESEQNAVTSDSCALHTLCVAMLKAVLSPNALGLYRLLLAEAGRFPELALAADREGGRKQAVAALAAALRREFKDKKPSDAALAFDAEQLLILLTTTPRANALGMGKPLTPVEQEEWVKQTLRLFLDGYRAKG